MAATDYGVLAQAVATGGSLIAAVGALVFTWKGRFKWEPAEQDIPSGAQKTAGLLIAIVIGTLWYKFVIARTLSGDDLILVSWICAGAALFGLLVYGFLVGSFVYQKEVATGPTTVEHINIIGGLWLRPAAKNKLESDPSLTPQLLLKGAANNPDLLWVKSSRASTKALFQLAYIALIGFGTIALTAISLLIASTMQPAPAPVSFAPPGQYVAVGCGQTTQPIQVVFTLPERAAEVQHACEWTDVSNVKTAPCAHEVRGNTVIATGTITGLDKDIIGNCKGGGHGTLRLTGSYKISAKS